MAVKLYAYIHGTQEKTETLSVKDQNLSVHAHTIRNAQKE